MPVLDKLAIHDAVHIVSAKHDVVLCGRDAVEITSVRLHSEHYRNWIALLQFASDDSDVLALTADNQLVAHYVQTHLFGIVAEAVEAIFGPRRHIRISVVS